MRLNLEKLNCDRKQFFDAMAAEHFGDIFADLERKGLRIGDRDMMIAGHARALGCTLVTNNTRELCRVQGLRVEDWKRESFPSSGD